jgi:addiction module HigA family antidote
MLMKMHNPMHPGEILKELWLEPDGLSITRAAGVLGVGRKRLSNIVNGKSAVTAEIAVRLSIVLGTSAEVWLGHQNAHDLWQLEQRRNQINAKPLAV